MSFAKVSSFFEYVRKKGIVAPNTVTGWSGAFSAVEGVLDESEKDLDFILNNTDIIRNRLQNQNHEISGGTLNIYLQRATRAISAFKEWDIDRASWEKKMANSNPNKATSSTPGSKNISKSKTIKEDVPSNDISSLPKSKKIFPIPTANGETFDVALPSSYKMSDLPKVIWALAVYADDFNPSEVLARYGTPPLNDTRNTVSNQIPIPSAQ